MWFRFSRVSRLLAILTVVVAAAGVGVRTGRAQQAATAKPQPGDDAALIARAKAIHERVITLDTHNDISPANFQWSRNYTIDLGNQVNLPKMKAGGLDVSFFIVYVGQSNAPDAGGIAETVRKLILGGGPRQDLARMRTAEFTIRR